MGDPRRTSKDEMFCQQLLAAAPDSPREPGGSREPDFTSSAGLRALLDRLHSLGDGAWRDDPDATALLAHCRDRYAALARAWHRDPGDAATAAFLAMRENGVRRAHDPWAVVTRAVQVSLSAENHADRHMTSTEKARRIQHAALDVPLRAGDYAETLTLLTASVADEPPGADGVETIIADATALLTLLGWPEPIAAAVVEYVVTRVQDVGSLSSAVEALRRDTAIRVQLDLDRTAWTGLLGVLLGARPLPGRPRRKGVVARLLLGDTVHELLDDTALVRAVLDTLPERGGSDPDA